MSTVATIDRVRAQLGDVTAWSETDERAVELGLTYGDGDPVVVAVRKRGRNVDIDDCGDAIGKARSLGAPANWLELADRLLAEEGFNVNRRGVIFVPAFEWRDVASLALRLGESAYSVHSALLDHAG